MTATQTDTDPRKTRRLINALGRTAHGWEKLWALLQAKHMGAAAEWVDAGLLAVELDERKAAMVEDLGDHDARYQSGELTLDLQEASPRVKGHAPRYLVTQGGDILGAGDTPAEAIAEVNATPGNGAPLTKGELYHESAPREQQEGLGTVDPLYLVRTSDDLTREQYDEEAFEVVDKPEPGAETTMLATPAGSRQKDPSRCSPSS